MNIRERKDHEKYDSPSYWDKLPLVIEANNSEDQAKAASEFLSQLGDPLNEALSKIMANMESNLLNDCAFLINTQNPKFVDYKNRPLQSTHDTPTPLALAIGEMWKRDASLIARDPKGRARPGDERAIHTGEPLPKR